MDCIDTSLDDALKVFIDQQCRRLEISIKTEIQETLPAAARYFARCHKAHHQCSERLSPPNLAELEISGHAMFNDASMRHPAATPGGPDNSLQAAQSLEVPVPNRDSGVSVDIDSLLQEQPTKPGAKRLPDPPKAEKGETVSVKMSDTMKEKAAPKPPCHGKSPMESAMWEMKELEKGDMSQSWFEFAIQRKLDERSAIFRLFECCGMVKFLPNTEPKNMLSPIAGSPWFQNTVLVAIVLNTGFSLYVADAGVRKVLATEPEPAPDWWDNVDVVFTTFFAVELVVRLGAYRFWFFIAPHRWKSNLFDFTLVVTSAITASMSTVDLLFFRCLRIFRVVRMARVVRVVNAFTELRKLLFAVLSCMPSLFWAVLFLAVTFCGFSLVIMQGVKSELPKMYDNEDVVKAVREQFDGLGACFITLLKIVGGPDWVEPHQSLSELGIIYGMVMPTFVCFVQVGIMNIVIGVFAQATSRMADRDLVARDMIGDLEDFVEAMVSLYREFAPLGDGKEINWEAFINYFNKEDVQAYLAHHQLDVSHVRLIYELFDVDGEGGLDIHEFVLGLLRYKGEAKGLDMKVMLHSLTALGLQVSTLSSNMSKVLDQNVVLADLIEERQGFPLSVV